jgi:hypothetical protein
VKLPNNGPEHLPPDGSTDRPVGLKNTLPSLQPPGWLDEHILSVAHQQARMNAQVRSSTNKPKKSWLSSNSWVPWAGSLASAAVVLLLVTAQPLPPEAPARQTVDEAPAMPTAPATTAPTTTAPASTESATTRPAPTASAPTRSASASDSEPPVEAAKRAPTTGTKPAPPSRAAATSPPARAKAESAQPQASSPSVLATPSVPSAPSPPSVDAIDSANTAREFAKSAPPRGAAGVRQSTENQSSENQSAESKSYPSPTGAADAITAPNNERRAAVTPRTESVGQCAQQLDELLLASRKREAQQLFRRCAERFPEHIWPPVLRQRLELVEPKPPD